MYWVHSLRAEILITPALAEADRRWSTTALKDLAFSLETRIGNLTEIARETDESIRIIGAELDAEADLGFDEGVRSVDEVATRRVIIGLNMLVVRIPAPVFESLAQFYREFPKLLGETISKPDSYAKVAACVPVARSADMLGSNRHDIVHGRSPWLRFDVEMEPRHYEPVLILEYRLEVQPGPEDEISVAALGATQVSLRRSCKRAQVVKGATGRRPLLTARLIGGLDGNSTRDLWIDSPQRRRVRRLVEVAEPTYF